eukprot:1007221-Rhodomonas_salina.3
MCRKRALCAIAGHRGPGSSLKEEGRAVAVVPRARSRHALWMALAVASPAGPALLLADFLPALQQRSRRQRHASPVQVRRVVFHLEHVSSGGHRQRGHRA